MHPPDPATALNFILERWYFAFVVIRSSRGSPTDAELAPITARHAAASETVDWLQESENIRKAILVLVASAGDLRTDGTETTNRAADDLGSMELGSSRLAVVRKTTRTNER